MPLAKAADASRSGRCHRRTITIRAVVGLLVSAAPAFSEEREAATGERGKQEFIGLDGDNGGDYYNGRNSGRYCLHRTSDVFNRSTGYPRGGSAGALNSGATSEAGTAVSRRGAAQGGRYSLDRHTLTLIGDDGRSPRALFAYGSQEHPPQPGPNACSRQGRSEEGAAHQRGTRYQGGRHASTRPDDHRRFPSARNGFSIGVPSGLPDRFWVRRYSGTPRRLLTVVRRRGANCGGSVLGRHALRTRVGAAGAEHIPAPKEQIPNRCKKPGAVELARQAEWPILRSAQIRVPETKPLRCMNLTIAQILDLAPDAGSRKSGLDQAKSGKWSAVGRDGSVI